MGPPTGTLARLIGRADGARRGDPRDRQRPARLDEVLQLIVDRVRELVGARYAALGHRRRRTAASSASSRAGSRPSSAPRSARSAAGPRPAGPDHPRGSVVPDPGHRRASRAATASRPTTRRCTRSSACPMRVEGRPVGNFYLTDKHAAPRVQRGRPGAGRDVRAACRHRHRERAAARAGPAAGRRRRARADQPGPARRDHPEHLRACRCRSRTCPS